MKLRLSITTVTVLGSLFLVQPALAFSPGMTLVQPNGGECLQGGASYTIKWTPPYLSGIPVTPDTQNDPGIHYALAFRGDGSTYPIPYGPTAPDESLYFAHPVNGNTTTYEWTVPNTTTNKGKIYIEFHAPVGRTESNDVSMGVPSGSFAQSASSFSIDASAPSTSTINVSSKDTKSVNLTWSASSDEGCKGLSGYKIYRDGSLISTVGASTTSYLDSGLTSSKTYAYKVTAYDDFASTDSSALLVTTDAVATTATPTTKATAKPTATITPTPVATTPIASASPSPVPPLIALTSFKIGSTTLSAKDAYDMTPKVTIGEKIHLTGTAPADSTIFIYLHSQVKTFETTVSSDGTWSYGVPTTDLPAGTHTLGMAQRQSDGTIATETTVAHFSAETPAIVTTPATTSQAPIKHSSTWLWLLGLVVVLGGLSVTLWLVNKKKQVTIAQATSLGESSSEKAQLQLGGQKYKTGQFHSS